MREIMLQSFIDKIRKSAFVNSVNSVTTKEEKLNPVVEDMEAIIKISGEWDREDLKKILASLFQCPDCGYDMEPRIK